MCEIFLLWSNLLRNVANPLSRQTVQIPPPPPFSLGFPKQKYFKLPGIATKIENGIVSGYKVICIDMKKFKKVVLNFMMYSSKTSSWNFKKVHSTIPLFGFNYRNFVSLNRKIYWTALDESGDNYLICHDFYSSSDQYSVIPFPELKSELQYVRFSKEHAQFHKDL